MSQFRADAVIDMAAPMVTSTSTEPEPIVMAPSKRRLVLWLLMLTMFLSFLDRQIINILAEPIKGELGLADWHIGILTGSSFALVYTGLAIPVAWLAARMSRPALIAGSVAFWSICTFASGFALNFSQLVAARIAVGGGEAGGVPPGHSLISDITPREERASALATFHLGIPIGTLAGLALGGILLDHVGWRGAFMVAGLPGLLIALLVYLMVREPRRQAGVTAMQDQTTIGETLAYLAKKRSFWLMGVAGSFKSFVGYAHIPFTAAFFFRVHAAELDAMAAPLALHAAGLLGIALGLINGIGGSVGTWLGGMLADRWGKKDARAYATLPAIAGLSAMPFMLAAYIVPSAAVSLLLLMPAAVLNFFYFGPVHFTGQSVVPARMRANASAVMLVVLNVIGMGFGPLLVGLMSDGFSSAMGMNPAEGVRFALITSTLLGLPTCALFLAARRTIRTDLVS